MNQIDHLTSLCNRIRYNIITSTTAAGSGHPSSSLSAVELLTTLFFDGLFKQDVSDFQNPLNDKFILSKGHAAPLLYALYEVAGVIKKEELLTLRKFDSRLQGHPTPSVPFVDVTTGSLGQGLSVGVGMALGLKIKAQNQNSNQNLNSLTTIYQLQTPRVFVLLGDSEFAEGQNYEAMQLASHYKLGNLIAILDGNRLGQRGETQVGWHVEEYKKRAEAFGWNVIMVENGNDISQVQSAFSSILAGRPQDELVSTGFNWSSPTMIIAKTVKGAGVSFMENKDNWHGKAIPKDKLDEVLKEIGNIDFSVVGLIEKPGGTAPGVSPTRADSRTAGEHWRGNEPGQNLASPISTREAYGHSLAYLAKQNKSIIALDAETSNSTYAEFVKKETPEQFIECYIAEQNMIGMALGLSKLGFIPFASSFAAFLSRAYDQIRMSQYSLGTSHYPLGTLNIVGSHAGCSIGVDGASQMALEDISMMRSMRESTVLYPSDGVSSYKLTQLMAVHPGINYLRTTRDKTPILYGPNEEFPIGGLKIFEITNNKLQISNQLQSTNNKFEVVIVTAGITVHEALKAQKILEEKQIHTVVVDLYSIKPLDSKNLHALVKNTNHLIVVEDHYEAGGIGEAVKSVILGSVTTPESKNDPGQARMTFTHLCVRKEPRSGTMEELLRYEEIDATAIVKTIFSLLMK